jgi:glucose/arabinose dehydrogenase
LASILLLLIAYGCGTERTTDPVDPPIHLEVAASGLQMPVHLTAPTGDSRLFIVEKRGTIRIVKNGQLLAAPFLDVRTKVSTGSEQGLLSVAFHPQYASNGYFFVNYTDTNGDTRVERYHSSPAADVADANSSKLILMVDQPYSNHNGGLVLFGPDNMLYIGMGDGGSGGDPQGNGQNRATLLGDLLRIDVDKGDPYSIPTDNPFVGQTGMRGEIWAWGLRNPWRFTFDRTAGLLYIADVGQNAWEEIHVVGSTQKGVNYGWNLMEGRHCYRGSTCNTTGLTQPVLEYNHSEGCSVTGGSVYRGTKIPSLQGTYFYADYCQGWVRSFKYVNGAVTAPKTWEFGSIGNILSFGSDAAGEIYVLSANGNVYRLAN